MGQYYNGEKIGTCENMYYMRMSQAEKLASVGACDDDHIKFSDYLKDGETRFRFPWPDEDGREAAGLFYSNVTDFERGITIPVPQHITINHGTICVSNCHKGGGYNFNMIIPCPHSEDFARLGLRTSTGGVGRQHITIRYKAMRKPIDHATQKEIEGVPLEATTLYECARCGQLQRSSREELEEIKEYAREDFRMQYKLVAQRDLDNAELVASNAKELAGKLEIIDRI